MGCSLSAPRLREMLETQDRVEPMGDIHAAHLDLWLMAAFSAAATAWIFRDDDMLDKLQEDMSQAPLGSVLNGKVQLLQQEFLDLPSDLQAWVMKMNYDGQPWLVVIYRGMEVDKWADISTVLEFWKTPVKLLGETVRVHSGVHQNFRTGEGPVANVMEKFLDDRRWSRKREDIRVLVTGQSLGGALSQLAALAYHERFPDLTFHCVTFGAFRIGGDGFQRLYDKHLVEPGRSLRVTRYLDFVPMLPNKSSFRSVGSGVFLKNQRLYKRSHYPTNVNLQLFGQLLEDMTNGVMIWHNHNVWAYREDFIAAILHIQRGQAETSYRRLESYLSAGGPDAVDEPADEGEEEEHLPEEDKQSTLHFFALLQRQATSRHLLQDYPELAEEEAEHNKLEEDDHDHEKTQVSS